MSEDDEKVTECPYCGAKLRHPYWAHVQEKHPEEYQKKETWISLFKDYKSMGMDDSICYTVIGELFNAPPDEVKFFVEKNS
ncbi:MAG: hypothetical protein GF317_16565 [Candidatus Lokiarchaeota archaeon]|nr:hypothetical protein [Candidatus Lokiarchaeota archaeon]MBD3201133.1 hypothetical protein [Candidatus Lokiarchaeota archaeon]